MWNCDLPIFKDLKFDPQSFKIARKNVIKYMIEQSYYYLQQYLYKHDLNDQNRFTAIYDYIQDYIKEEISGSELYTDIVTSTFTQQIIQEDVTNKVNHKDIQLC